MKFFLQIGQKRVDKAFAWCYNVAMRTAKALWTKGFSPLRSTALFALEQGCIEGDADLKKFRRVSQ
jgi:hypothetical protein